MKLKTQTFHVALLSKADGFHQLEQLLEEEFRGEYIVAYQIIPIPEERCKCGGFIKGEWDYKPDPLAAGNEERVE